MHTASANTTSEAMAAPLMPRFFLFFFLAGFFGGFGGSGFFSGT